MADKLKIRAEDVEPGDVVITFHGKRYTVKVFWEEDGVVTLFGTDGSETEYDYDEILDVERGYPMTTNNHPAHGPVSLDRLHQISEILSKAAAQSDGGNIGYAMADAVKVIDEVLERRKDDDKNLVKERQRVIDGLCTIGETAWEIEEYMKKWDAEHVAMKSFGNSEQLIKHQSNNQGSDGNASGDEIKQPSSNEPVTLIKPVADLYGITSPTGSETTFTFDAVEASSFVGSGWHVQEYVELERYQEAMTANSPATPDGWVMVPKEMTPEIMRSVQRDSSLGTFASAHLNGAFDMYREFWSVAIAAAQK